MMLWRFFSLFWFYYFLLSEEKNLSDFFSVFHPFPPPKTVMRLERLTVAFVSFPFLSLSVSVSVSVSSFFFTKRKSIVCVLFLFLFLFLHSSLLRKWKSIVCVSFSVSLFFFTKRKLIVCVLFLFLHSPLLEENRLYVFCLCFFTIIY